MSRRCTICGHPQRAEIDGAGVAGTETIRDIAGQYRIGKSALARHFGSHVSAKLAKAAEAAEVASADSLLAQAQRLLADAQAIQAEAMGAFDHRTALQAVREQARLLDLLGRLLGELGGQGAVTVHAQQVLIADVDLRQVAIELAKDIRAGRLRPPPILVEAVASAGSIPEESEL